MDDNNKLQNSYVYIILGLLAAVFVGAVCIAVRCYPPYSVYFGVISSDFKSMLWTFMLLPSVVLPLSLWLSNMLNPRLSRFSLLSVLLCCCYFAAVPRLYKLFDPARMSVTTSLFAFFLISCCFTAVIKDIKRKRSKKWVNVTFGLIFTLVFALLSVCIGYFIICLYYFDRTAVCALAPILCLVYALGALIDAYAPATVVLSAITVGYSVLCAAFELMNKRILFFILLGLLALSIIWQITDIIKNIRSKENDSKSGNA